MSSKKPTKPPELKPLPAHLDFARLKMPRGEVAPSHKWEPKWMKFIILED